MSEEIKPGAAAPPLGSAERMASVKSPLSGLDPRSLDAIMQEDITRISDQEFDRVIAELRAKRKVFMANEAAADAAGATRRGAGKPAAPKGPKAPKGSVNITMDDLDLG